MLNVKDIKIKPIPSHIANEFVRRVHYSGKVVPNSQIHFGAFYNGALHGVMSFGASTDKRKVIGLVQDTPWNGFLELNRMAFDEELPRNSESRSIAIAMRLLRKNAPHVKWVLSFADGCQCGDGTIYRASGFLLTQIKKNTGMRQDEHGNVYSQVTFSAHRPNEMDKFRAMQRLEGYQLRYIYFLDQTYRDKLTVPVLPFSEIDNIGAGMYKGSKIRIEDRQ